MKFEEKWENEQEDEEGVETWPGCFAGGQYVPSYKRAGIIPVPGWRRRPISDTTMAVKRSGRRRGKTRERWRGQFIRNNDLRNVRLTNDHTLPPPAREQINFRDGDTFINTIVIDISSAEN